MKYKFTRECPHKDKVKSWGYKAEVGIPNYKVNICLHFLLAKMIAQIVMMFGMVES